MTDKYMDEIKRLADEIELELQMAQEEIQQLTAPCGIPCFACYMYLAFKNEALKPLISKVMGVPEEKAACAGCRATEGKCGHLPMACRVYPCADEKKIHNCSECADFPCNFLHPYADKAFTFHNTKIFQLCLIKKMGLENWAEKKARSVRDKYSFGQWTL